MVPCSHEEADTSLLLHIADTINRRCRKVCVHTVDTDVVVLAIAEIDADELWVAFAQGPEERSLPRSRF